jgi:hypothetical protein
VSWAAANLARALKGRGTGKGQWIARCPAHEDRHPSLSIGEGERQSVVFKCHAGCSPVSIIDVLRARGLWTEEERERPRRNDGEAEHRANSEQIIAEDEEEKCKRQRAQEIWRTSTPLSDPDSEIGQMYLIGRNLPPPWPETIAFKRIPYPGGPDDVPALIVARHCPANNDHVRGIQRIYLTEDSQKYDGALGAKLSLGRIRGGRARLINTFPLERLIGAEGVETALSAHRIHGGPDLACWCMCGGFPKELVMPHTVEEVLLIADADENGGSKAKAQVLAEWIRSTGRKVCVLVPQYLGIDANDLLRRGEP